MIQRIVGVFFIMLLSVTWISQADAEIAESRSLMLSSQEVISFDRSINRVAVNNDNIINFELISNRELLIQAKEVGRTNILIWFADQTIGNYDYHVVTTTTNTETLIRSAIHDLEGNVGRKVMVKRIVRGSTPDRNNDIFILEGSVPNQVALTRVLTIAAKIISNVGSDDAGFIRVVGDEGGSLLSRQEANGSSSNSGSVSPMRSGGSSGGNLAGSLRNRISRSIGRAKVLEAANGRLISFLEVDDIPRIRVSIKIVEVDRSKLESYGSSLTVLGSDFTQRRLVQQDLPQSIGAGPAATFSNTPLSPGDPPDFQQALSVIAGAFTNQSQFTLSRMALDAVLTALESNGISRTLAEPTLNVLSGETAMFLVGGQIPISTTTATTSVVVNSIEFVDHGVEVAVRPLVDEDNQITLDVIPRVSEPVVNTVSSVTSAPAFETKTLKTTARMQDGQSLIVGGLIQRNLSQSDGKTPGLGDVPIAGRLFRSDLNEDTVKDVLIIVTPAVEREASPELGLWKFD